MQLFYVPQLASHIQLSEEESKHAVRVLRLQQGDVVQLVDGKGTFCDAKVLDNHPKRCLLEVVKQQEKFGQRNFELHLAVAPTKNIDRFEYFLEKATEIGMDAITPLLCQRSERKVVKPERLNKIIVAAMKQSVKAYLPTLKEMTSFNHFVQQDFDGQKFIAHCIEEERHALKEAYIPATNALVLIGPEGDFSPEEIEMAIAHSFQPISLGNSRLRTETAALVACHTINLLNE